ncbi:MAG: ubiquinone/menaquinone biosynthesis C-methylase UbiE [Lentisphaeria bacterium]|jgi:ubiquinone/menaquinone biosynthesis C-methylase UbiE
MHTVDFNKIAIKNGDVLLDLGCGEGRHAMGVLFHAQQVLRENNTIENGKSTEPFTPNFKVIAVDLSHKDLCCAKGRHENFDRHASSHCLYTQTMGQHLPFAAHSFDHVICSEVLEHIDDYQNFLSEIKRVLKPGGSLNISVPRSWPEKICWRLSSDYHQVEGGHIRIFNSAQLQNEIESLNFTFIGRHWAHALHVPYWWLRCAFWSRGETFFATRMYHAVLVWDLLKKPKITRILESLLNPIMGKSTVMYFSKPEKIS